MRRLKSGVFGSFAAALVIAACAGKSTSNGGTDAGSGGGASTGGAAVTGGTSSGGTGTEPEPNPDCLLAPESGNCDAYFVRYAFDPRTGVCGSFVYGGCGGNANNFLTLADCYQTCMTPGRTDFAACTGSDQCAVRVPGCCGACEPTEFVNFVAVNSTWGDAYYTATCDRGTTCGACPEPTGTFNTPYFTATCDAGHCAVVDLRLTEATACTDSAECRLRNGSWCCENCMPADPMNLIAISSEQALRSIACETSTGCDACLPEYPPGAAGECVDGRCVVDLNLR